MKQQTIYTVVAAAVIAGALVAAYATFARGTDTETITGNGGPSGPHVTLNVIGVPKGKTGDFSGGSRMFVPLEGNCRINLSPGDFAVLDGNCTDGTASFRLPNPDPDGNGETAYTVWARTLGKPGGKATATTCAKDPTTGEDLCSIDSTALVRAKGKSTFTNVSKNFLSLTVYLGEDTEPTTLSIFDSRLVDYFWNYDNAGLKNLQLRFYQI